MAKKAYRVRNWKDYNKSLVQRGSLTFWFSEEVINNWKSDQKNNSHGNQKYSDMIVFCALTLRQLFRLPLRATEGMMKSLVEMLVAFINLISAGTPSPSLRDTISPGTNSAAGLSIFRPFLKT